MTNKEPNSPEVPFSGSLRTHMEKWCGDIGKRPPMWAKWTMEYTLTIAPWERR